MKFGNEFLLILFRKHISPKLFAVCLESWPRVALLYSVSFTTLEMHVIGTERRAQVRPTCSILEQGCMNHGQNLKSTPVSS